MTDWLLDQVFDFNGQQVRYAVRGDGPPLVFVHGTPFSSYVWHRIAPHSSRKTPPKPSSPPRCASFDSTQIPCRSCRRLRYLDLVF